MTAESNAGFLVVLADSGYENALNPRYDGVDRLPPYAHGQYATHFPEEAEPLDDYVFGDYKDHKSGLIPEYSRAEELWRRFSVSRRPYEILLCVPGPDDPLVAEARANAASVVALGYDVAGIGGDCWSIVEDIPNNEWARPYLQALNENGLLQTRSEAEQYLKRYRDHNEADSDSAFVIALVLRVIPA